MKKLERLENWDQRLALVTARLIRTPSVWGESDCLLKVCDAIEAVTGEDLAADIRGQYSTEAGAARLMRKRKAKNVEDVLAQFFEPVGRLLAQRGDVFAIEEDGQIAAGYITEYGAAVATPHGLAFRPQMAIKTAFKVGRE